MALTPEMSQIPTLVVETPVATVIPITMPPPTIPPVAPPTAPPLTIGLPLENSEWYIDGWREDSVVVNIHGQEIRSDLAQFRHMQTNEAIVVQCIDSRAGTPNLDFSRPIEQRDRFVYRGNIFWHTTDPTIQRFIFVRYGELQ